MPVLFEENRIRDSSAEKDAPRFETVSRNCSIVYCFGARVDAGVVVCGATRAGTNITVVAITVRSVVVRIM
jgi:hypothetical protein